MKNICLLLIVMLLIFPFPGCDHSTYYWEFSYNYEEIVEIKIIDIDYIGLSPTKDDFSVIKELDVSQAKELCEDIVALPMKRYGVELMSPKGKCFLIVFENGEFDIISFLEPKHCKYDNEGIIRGYNSWLFCDEAEFNELINKYLE